MKRPRPSLFAKILLWFFLSLVIIGAVLFGFFNLQFDLPPDSPLRGEAGKRIGTMVHLITHELHNNEKAKWDQILEHFGEAYELDFLLLSPRGEKVAGKNIVIPPELQAKITAQSPHGRRERPKNRERRWNRRMEMDPPPMDKPPGEPPPGDLGMGNPLRTPRPLFSMRTFHPRRYWVAVLVPLHQKESRRPRPAILLIGSDSLTGGGMLFDPIPWLLVFAVVLILSAVLWFPLVRSITRPIGKVRDAADKIARGQFGIILNDKRKDEIGQLSRSINEMAQNLEGFINGQKRFLGDAAHELASPIAKMELALSILERKVGPEATETLGDLREEVERMGHLVNELLSFSRAELNPGKVRLYPVNVAQIIDRSVSREKTNDIVIRIVADSDIMVFADPALLERALSNLVRNAIAYAAHAGPIEVVAEKQNEGIFIEIRDQGPGVPEKTLKHLFEPFFRPDPSRSLSTGGVGLGLAIVKTCVQACNGKVTAENLEPGFCVKMEFRDSK